MLLYLLLLLVAFRLNSTGGLSKIGKAKVLLQEAGGEEYQGKVQNACFEI